MKKIVSLLIAVSLCLSVILSFPLSSSAAQPTSGHLGENITWSVSGDVLTISGTGVMTEKVPRTEEEGLHENVTKVVIEDGITELPEEAFAKYLNLVSVELADSVTKLGDGVFGKCYDLENVKMSKNLEYIGAGAFVRCSLSEIYIPESVTYIGDFAFMNNYPLHELHIPDGVTYIGKGIIHDCNNFVKLTVGKNNKKYYSTNNCIIERDAKTLIAGCNTSIIPSDGSVTKIAEYAFGTGMECKKMPIPEGIVEIGDFAFKNCEGLRSITLPSSITSIGEGAFYGCLSVVNISIPNKPISIGTHAFNATAWYLSQPAGVVYLDNHAVACNDRVPVDIVIKDGTLTIADGIWASSLESIVIPKSVVYIGEEAFVTHIGKENFSPENLTVLCYSGSYAETYCKQKELNYKLLDLSVSDNATDANEDENKNDDKIQDDPESKANLKFFVIAAAITLVVIAIAVIAIILIKKHRTTN